ncbi:MAG TPA: hypothetical protein VN445_14945 [Rectinemataceae bacterium]|nr:hypothetical protein [Rectinemataceae bacterium]
MKTIKSTYEYAIPEKDTSIGAALAGWQDSLKKRGGSFGSHLDKYYLGKWRDPLLADVMAIRTGLILAMQEFLADRGLSNIDRVSLSPVTDPLCHDVEHVPVIRYKNVPYRTTHSMIYSKFLACTNPAIKGIFIDSPNIRLELPHTDPIKQKKYLIDFSQMDMEAKRSVYITDDEYFDEPEKVTLLLEKERDEALDFFEDMIISVVRKVKATCPECLASLGVALEVPQKPFPRFYKDESGAEEGMEARLGATAGTQFFWVLGLLRENYDLVYPFLKRDGSFSPLSSITSRQVFNYDLCAAAKYLDGSLGEAFELLSGGLREWFYPAIIARLLQNGILSEAPRFDDRGDIENMEELEGYGPFLSAVAARTPEGGSFFPQTFGGGIGIERTLYTLLQGPKIHSIDEVTFFGKNPDQPGPFLF